MHDFLLGGIENYESDRAACTELLRVAPGVRESVRDSRAFLERAVRYLARERRVRQFLDLGSGLPTRCNVHQIAQHAHSSSRVVYVDQDPIVLAHGRTTLEENANTAVVEADLADVEAVFADADVRRLIRSDEPSAVLLVSVLHCLRDETVPAAVVSRIADRLAPGSFLVMCQLVSDRPQVRRDVTQVMNRVTGGRWGCVRSKSEVAGYFAGMNVVGAGLVEVADWDPQAQQLPGRSAGLQEWGGVAQL
jgi:O-methyltransferase involved in polyketide biosynthesis